MQEDIQKEAIELVKGEVSKYKDGEFFITENIAIATRPLIRRLRKNYWGIYDNPIDPTTGKEKQWVPLTRLVVDAVRKNSDLDLKNINFRARHANGRPFTSLVRGFVRADLANRFFGETLNDTILQTCIDGTAVWKTYTTKEGGKLRIHRKTLDLLNIFIDPTAENIQEAQGFTERSLMSPLEVEAMTGWENTKDIKTAKNLHRIEVDLIQTAETGDYVDVYEYWGLIPGRWLKKDGLIHGHVTVSGIETGDLRVHLIEENTNKDRFGNVLKPYEELRYIKVPGRWAGVGPAEMVLKLQEWVNLIVHLRIRKNTAASLGLFKMRSGSGVTDQMFKNLVSSGVLVLNNIDDVENFAVAEAGETSYKDEEVAKNWAFEITNTYDIARGASLPATSTATSAAIEDRNAKTAFTIIIESIGLFVQRWMDRHYLPHVPKLIKQDKKVTLFSDFEDIEQIRQRVVAYYGMQQLEELRAQGYVPTKEELAMAMAESEAKLREDKELFFDVVDEIITDEVDTVAQFTNEEMDVAVTVKNLVDLSASLPPEVQKDFIMQGMDLMGLDIPESLRQLGTTIPGAAGPMQLDTQSPQSLTTEANLPV